MEQILSKIKIFTLMLIVVFLLSCSSNQLNNNDISLELITKEVHFVDIDSRMSELVRYDYTNEEKILAKNIISYRLTNNSKKKLLFAFNPENVIRFHPIDNQDTISSYSTGSIIYSITDENNQQVFSGGGVNHRISEYLNEFFDCRTSLDSLNKLKFNQLHPKVDFQEYQTFLAKSFVLNPNESKTFKFLIYLPIIEELHNPYDNAYEYKILRPEKQYEFKLLYFQDSLKVKRLLEDYEKIDLKNNNNEIFHGSLTSNAVQLILKKG